MKPNGTFDLKDIRNRVIELKMLKPGDLLDHPGQWRDHPPSQAEAMAGALREVGQTDALKAWYSEREGGKLVTWDGHLRKSLSPDVLWPVLITDLTDAEADYALATHDPLASMAHSDAGALDALLASFTSAEPGIQAMLAELAAESGLDYFGGDKPAEAPEPQIDRAAELQKRWGTERGQLWVIPSLSVPGREHRLLCGDSTSAEDVARLMRANPIQTVVFDPPYDGSADVLNVRYNCRDVILFTDHRHLLDCIGGWGRFRCLFVWDGVTSWYVPGWPLARAKLAMWFGESRYNPDGAHYGESDKAHTVTNTRGTYEYVPDPRGKHLSTVFQSPITREFDGHEHAKPVDWVRLLLGNCTGGDVLDLFAGSGTALVATEQLGRVCNGIEIEPATLAVVLERMAGMGLEPRLADG